MSILVVGGDPDVDALLVRRLVDEGDVVGLLVEDDGTIDRIDADGAHVAQGDRADEDLIERAAIHARTIVVYDEASAPRHGAIVQAVVAAARRLEGVRVVAWGPRHSSRLLADLDRSGLAYVVLTTGKLSGRFRKRVPFEAIVEAIDAADDLAGDVRLEVDLRRAEGWARLGLEVPV